MERVDARDEVYTTLKDFWDAGTSTSAIPLYYQDVHMDLPTDNPDPWALAEVIHTQSQTISLGLNRKIDIYGQLNVFVFTPLGDGLVLNDAICGFLLKQFELHKSFNIRYYDFDALEQGRSGVWQVTRVIIKFRYYNR